MSAVQPPRPPRPGWLPVVNAARCTGCGWCVASCSDLHLLSLDVVQWRKVATLHDADRCTGCSDCAVTCPFHVITMRKAEAMGPSAVRRNSAAP